MNKSKYYFTMFVILLFSSFIANNAFGIPVDGFCYLENASDHSGTKILFEAVSPSAVTDSTFTNSDGSFLIGITVGIYTIHYSHEGWQTYTIPEEIAIFEYTSLEVVTLLTGFVEEVSGEQNGIWTADYIYLVVDDISINLGDTLIIEPGAHIKFMNYYSFNIYGTLLAVGTESDTIIFTSGNITPNLGDWHQINFNGNLSSNSIISYTKVKYSWDGIYCNNSSPNISNNSIIYNRFGIWCINNSLPSISNNTICYNSNGYSGYGGIRCENSSPTIDNNIINNNSGRGISCIYSSSPTISNNTINYNGCGDINSSTIYCYNSSSPSIYNNTISHNNTTAIYFFQNSSPIIYNNTINNNINGIESSDNCFPFIYNNILMNNSATSILCYESLSISNNIIKNSEVGIYCYSSSIISNNTIMDNDYGINIWPYYSSNIINNILYNNDCGIYHESTPLVLEYNIFWQNNTNSSGDGFPSYFEQIITVNTNGDSCDTYFNLFMDPIFVNPDSLDFHLLSTSPCIDAGTPDTTGLNLPQFDLDGNPRIYNGIIDIGCYEWQGTGVDDWYHSPIANVLYQNYPNPFSSSTTISFHLAIPMTIGKNTQINIYNVKGQLVRQLFPITIGINGQLSIEWDGKDENGRQLSNGIYFYQLKTENYSEVKKMVIIR
ncbi:MAG: right-handed parallel beta-helix repeat-containing protein [Candidatus Cloacimonetes bacterium]|nr:right-handed parallel beta-helix repeat-containing protein [Candidatus Cloacimonadota bacterium]